MKFIKRLSLIALLAFITLGSSSAQTRPSSDSNLDSTEEKKKDLESNHFLDKMDDAWKKEKDSIKIDLKNLISYIPQSDSTLNEALLQYNIRSLKHRRNVFQWQYISSIVIFFMVVFIVSIGLFLSYLHFKNDLKNGQTTNHELELNKAGLKINSSVIGLIILIISIAFLFLYLEYVYDIQELVKYQ